MRFSNFVNGCFGKVAGGIFCIILGVVLAYGGLILGGYFVINRDGMMGTIEDYAQQNDIPINFEEDYRDLSIFDWGKEVLSVLRNFSSKPIEEIELILGFRSISQTLSDVTGIPEDAVKKSSFSSFGETFSENVTLQIASDKFGVEFPDIPIFEDEEYLQTPLSTALKDLDNYTLAEFVEIDENSSPLMQSVAEIKIGELSDPESGLDTKINSLMLHEVVEIVEEGPNKSNNVLIHLKDVEIGQLGTSATNDLIMQMTLKEVIDIDEENKVIYELRDKTLAEIGTEEAYNDILNMPIADLMNIDDNSSRVLQYFKENQTTLDGDDGGINAALKIMTLGDMMEINDPSEPGGSLKLLWVLRNCPLETIPAEGGNPEVLGIEDTLKITSVKDLFETGSTYVWNYIGQSTIEDIGQRIDDMEMRHVMEITSSSPAIIRRMREFDPLIDNPGEENLFGTENIKVSQLDQKLEPLVQGMPMGELITIDSNSELILQALQDTPLIQLNDKLAILQIKEIFEEEKYTTGFLSLIDPETIIYDIADELENSVGQARMQRLINIGIANDFSLNNDEYKAKMRNSTISQTLEDFAAIVNNPAVTASRMTPKRHYLSEVEQYLVHASIYTINMQLLQEIPNFEEGDTIVLADDASIAAEDFTMIFNVITDSYTLEILSGATIRSATFDGEKYMDKGGYMFFGTGSYPAPPSGTGYAIGGGGTIIGDFIPTPGIIDNAEILVEIDP